MTFPSDLEIARGADLQPLEDIAGQMGIRPGLLEPYGRGVAKISLDAIEELSDRPRAKYVLISAITPTPLGEGKTTTTVGLGQGFGHIGKRATIAVMHAKEPYASYIVSQICFDPQVTARWIAAVRARGTRLPIHIGLPGAVDLAKLVRISMRVGIGDSLRFVRKQGGTVARLIGGYQPDALVDGLLPTLADPAMGVAGWHLFTFNEIRRTEAWRQGVLARYAS